MKNIFYLLGGIVLIVAGIFLVTKIANAEDNNLTTWEHVADNAWNFTNPNAQYNRMYCQNSHNSNGGIVIGGWVFNSTTQEMNLTNCTSWEGPEDIYIVISNSCSGQTFSQCASSAFAIDTIEGFTGDGATITAPVESIIGCMDPEANNYDETATEDEDPSLCTYDEETLPLEIGQLTEYLMALGFVISIFSLTAYFTSNLVRKIV